MKKIKLEGKLNLNKETVTRLNEAQLKSVNGGTFMTLKGCNVNDTRRCFITEVCQTLNLGCTINQTVICQTEALTACQSRCGDLQCI